MSCGFEGEGGVYDGCAGIDGWRGKEKADANAQQKLGANLLRASNKILEYILAG